MGVTHTKKKERDREREKHGLVAVYVSKCAPRIPMKPWHYCQMNSHYDSVPLNYTSGIGDERGHSQRV